MRTKDAMGATNSEAEEKTMATAGRFTVKDGQVIGPKAYMESDQFKKTAEKIQNGTHCLLGMFPAGQDPDLSVAVIIQTDFAAWLGYQEISAMCGKGA